MKEYKVGDKVWWIPGYRDERLIMIASTVTEVDDTFRRAHPDAYLFYWIDEPTGHSLDGDEVFDTREEAEEELINRAYSSSEIGDELILDTTLEQFREIAKHFIMMTWVRAGIMQEWTVKYPEKTPGTEWLNLNHLNFKPE
jgi:hypothetical protein